MQAAPGHPALRKVSLVSQPSLKVLHTEASTQNHVISATQESCFTNWESGQGTMPQHAWNLPWCFLNYRKYNQISDQPKSPTRRPATTEAVCFFFQKRLTNSSPKPYSDTCSWTGCSTLASLNFILLLILTQEDPLSWTFPFSCLSNWYC